MPALRPAHLPAPSGWHVRSQHFQMSCPLHQDPPRRQTAPALGPIGEGHCKIPPSARRRCQFFPGTTSTTSHTHSLPSQTRTPSRREGFSPGSSLRPQDARMISHRFADAAQSQGATRRHNPLREASRTVWAGHCRGQVAARTFVRLDPPAFLGRWPAFPAVWVLWRPLGCGVFLGAFHLSLAAWLHTRGNRSHVGWVLWFPQKGGWPPRILVRGRHLAPLDSHGCFGRLSWVF